MCVAVPAVEVAPSPKFQLREVTVPLDSSVKVKSVWPATPVVGLTPIAALSAVVTVTVTTFDGADDPAEFTATTYIR